jgi:gliding motility-associated-like protein
LIASLREVEFYYATCLLLVYLAKGTNVNFTGRLRITIVFIIAFASCLHTKGQLCQGSLGDPVVNINFGAGSNFGPALSSSITTYNYIYSECPNDGSYTIANSTFNCFNSSWHAVAEDHTPNDVNGYMMVANASFAAGDFYIETVGGLCAGTTYEFAAWIANVQRGNSCFGNPITPNLTFNIETTTGTVLLSNKTGDIPFHNSVTWRQYGAFFTLPANTSSVVIRMTNNSPGGCGNDVLLDDITFRPCGALVTATIENANTTADICFGEDTSFTFTGDAVSQEDLYYQWQSSGDSGSSWNDIAGAVSNTYKSTSISAIGTYLFRLSVSKGTNNSASGCRVVSNVLSINVNAPPVAATSNNGPVCEGENLVLRTANGANFSWTGPSNFIAQTQEVLITNAKEGNSGKYYVTATSDKGCQTRDSTVATVNKTITVDAGTSSIDICEGQSTELNGSGSAGVEFLWTPSTGLSAANSAKTIAQPVDSTMYILTVSSGGCKSSDTVTVNVFKKPVANAGPDKEMLQGESVVLNGSAVGSDVSFFWSPNSAISSTSILQPFATPAANTTFTLHVVSNKGCGSSTDNVLVKVYKKITIPNAFSPNNDGINDRWQINQLNLYPEAYISVFNRYGQQVYSNKGLYTPWNGTYKGRILPAGTYYYVIDLRMRDLKYTGWVFIVQ